VLPIRNEKEKGVRGLVYYYSDSRQEVDNEIIMWGLLPLIVSSERRV